MELPNTSKQCLGVKIQSQRNQKLLNTVHESHSAVSFDTVEEGNPLLEARTVPNHGWTVALRTTRQSRVSDTFLLQSNHCARRFRVR